MKKIFLLSIAISGLIYFLSCKKDIKECSTCYASYSSVTSVLDGESLNFKNYSTIKQKNWLVSEVNENLIQRVLEILKVESNFSSNERVSTIVVFSGNKINSTFSLNTETYLGAIIYYIYENKLYTRTIELDKDKKINIDFSTTTDAVSINDYYNIGEILFSEAKSLVVLHNNAVNKTELLNSEPTLANNIRKSNHYRLKALPIYESNGCWSCLPGRGDKCKFNQWTLKEECWKNCGIRFFEGYGDNNLQLSFNIESFKNSLYNFRDNTLSNSSRGSLYIQKYEYVSEKVIYSNINVPLSFCASSLTFIHSEIIPIVNKLSTSPNSSDILYNEMSKDLMLKYLESTKQYILDPESINIIDGLKNEVSTNCNKTVYEVTQHLNTP
jgi:hypothetical protein